MNNSECKRLAMQLEYAFEGPAWHGPPIRKVLSGISTGNMLNNYQDSHNIAELIEHMTAWRIFVIKKLQGDQEYDVSDAENFVSIREPNAARLEEAIKKLEDSQQELLRLIRALPDEKLLDIVPLRKYDFYVLIQGIIQHDLYHLGQIILLAKG